MHEPLKKHGTAQRWGPWGPQNQRASFNGHGEAKWHEWVLQDNPHHFALSEQRILSIHNTCSRSLSSCCRQDFCLGPASPSACIADLHQCNVQIHRLREIFDRCCRCHCQALPAHLNPVASVGHSSKCSRIAQLCVRLHKLRLEYMPPAAHHRSNLQDGRVHALQEAVPNVLMTHDQRPKGSLRRRKVVAPRVETPRTTGSGSPLFGESVGITSCPIVSLTLLRIGEHLVCLYHLGKLLLIELHIHNASPVGFVQDLLTGGRRDLKDCIV
mmetsp:Transcript_44459/g.96690  ORF Transcript_44459/g.96690 Transcript_44459/m.96690 type:complete len:270 (-) Transcript_44459:668-1477(-)